MAFGDLELVDAAPAHVDIAHAHDAIFARHRVPTPEALAEGYKKLACEALQRATETVWDQGVSTATAVSDTLPHCLHATELFGIAEALAHSTKLGLKVYAEVQGHFALYPNGSSVRTIPGSSDVTYSQLLKLTQG